MSKVFIAFIGLTLVLSSCCSHKSIKKLSIARTNAIAAESSLANPPPITIWIHGTRFIRRPIFNSFFKGIPSLRFAKELGNDYYLRQIANTLCRICPKKFCMDTFFLFGWSGKLLSSAREQAATILFHEIKKVVVDYKKQYGVPPFIRVITHSHGGTVALNLVKIKETEGQPYKINELVLLACPVQETTRKYVEDDLFDHTFALYSSLDMVQVLAPQLVYNVFRTKKVNLRSRLNWPPFSHRRFQENPKLAQVKIKINGRALFHSEFTSHKFIAIFPHILHVINTWQTHKSVPYSTHLLCVYTQPDCDIKKLAPELV